MILPRYTTLCTVCGRLSGSGVRAVGGGRRVGHSGVALSQKVERTHIYISIYNTWGCTRRVRTSNHISRAAHTGHSPMLLYTHRPIMFTQSRRSIGSQRSRKRCTNTLMHAQRTAVRSKFILSSVLAVSAPHPRSSVSVAGSGQRAAGSGQRAAGSRAAPIPSEGGPLSPEIGGSNGEGRHGDEEGGGEAQAERRREASRTLERWLLRRAWGAAGETDHDLRGDPRSSGELRRADLTHLPRRWHRSVAGQKGGWGGLARGVGGGGG